MTRLHAFGAFWWDFLVGDDWGLTAGLLLALALTALLHGAGVPAWWLLPVAIALLLTRSLRRTSRGRR
jgi:hypothetical protein